MMIQWCDLCSSHPAQGILTIIPKGETQPINVMSCQFCVDDLDETDWLGNELLQGGHNAI